MYNMYRVANSIIKWHQENHKPCTEARLQGEMYYLDAAYTEHFGCRLIDSRFVQWGQGPMLPDLSRRYCLYSDVSAVQVGDDVAPFNEEEDQVFEKAMQDCSAMTDSVLRDKVDSMWFRERWNHGVTLSRIAEEG